MCSGISSPGTATSPSGNNGKSRVSRSGITPESTSVAPSVRPLVPAGAHQQVVEDGGREQGLEQPLVDPLEEEVAMERVLAPQHRHILRGRGRLERPVEPAKPVRDQLLA